MNNSMLSIKVFEEKLLGIVNSNHLDVGMKLSENHFAK